MHKKISWLVIFGSLAVAIVLILTVSLESLPSRRMTAPKITQTYSTYEELRALYHIEEKSTLQFGPDFIQQPEFQELQPKKPAALPPVVSASALTVIFNDPLVQQRLQSNRHMVSSTLRLDSTASAKTAFTTFSVDTASAVAQPFIMEYQATDVAFSVWVNLETGEITVGDYGFTGPDENL